MTKRFSILFFLLPFAALLGCVPSSPSLVGALTGQQTPLPPDDTLATPALAAITASPTSTATPTLPPPSTSTPLPTPTRTPWAVEADDMTDVELGVAWAVPAGWTELTGDVLPPQNEPILHRAWSDQPDGATIVDGASDFTDGLMLLTLTVESEDALLFPPEGSRQKNTIWGQEIFVGELTGEGASPFDLRLSSSALQTPYQYHLELGCAPPAGADDTAQQEFEANCRNIWHFISSPFGTCALPRPPAAATDSQQQVSNEYYGYSFEAPADWLRTDGPTSDRIDFISDPAAWSMPRPCVLPNGLMKLDFSVNPPGNFEPAAGPDLTRFQEVPGATLPMWTAAITDESGARDIGAAAHVRGPEYWYSFGLYCWPPHGADDEGQAAFQAQCDAAMDQILDSFQLIK